jgi:hypothetical protein
LLTALAALAIAAIAHADLRVVDAPAEPLGEALLPHQLDDPSVATSLRLLGSAEAVSRVGPWIHRLCLGDERAAARVAAGLEDAAAGGELAKEIVASAYHQILLGCPDGAPDAAYAAWLLRAARDAAHPDARAALFAALAFVHPLGEPEVFEREAPDDALVAYLHRPGNDIELVYSKRLAGLVERRVADGDPYRLRAAAGALARSSDPRAVATFRRLLAGELPRELRAELWLVLRESPRTEGFALFQTECMRAREQLQTSWRERGAPVHGSPNRWGYACERGIFPLRRSAAESAPALSRRLPPVCPPLPLALAVPREAEIGSCFDLVTTRGTQFAGDVELLRAMVRLVRPDLDAAVFRERWPAVDAVRLARGPLEQTIFVGGDAVRAWLPADPAGAPDAAVAAMMSREVEYALAVERWIDVEHGGVRRRFAFDPCLATWCAAEMLEIVNRLLDAGSAPIRLTRDDAEPHVLRLRIVAASAR